MTEIEKKIEEIKEKWNSKVTGNYDEHYFLDESLDEIFAWDVPWGDDRWEDYLPEEGLQFLKDLFFYRQSQSPQPKDVERINSDFEEKFRDNEEYFDIWDGNVEFRRGYKGYDSFLVDLFEFFLPHITPSTEEREHINNKLDKPKIKESAQQFLAEGEK